MAMRLDWKLRRVAAGLRQRDVAAPAGMSTTRYSTIERGEAAPTDTDSILIEKALPLLSELTSAKEAPMCFCYRQPRPARERALRQVKVRLLVLAGTGERED